MPNAPRRRGPVRVLCAWMLTGFCALLTDTGGAQPAPAPGTLALSLEDALERAIRASEEVMLARYAVGSAEGQRIAARSGFFPQVSLSASYERTLATEFDVAFTAPPMAAGEPAVDFESLPFGRENAYRATGTLTQNVFAGGRTLATTRAASELKRQAQIGVRSALAEARRVTVEAYYDALLSDRFVAIASQTVEQARATLEQVRLSAREGQQSEFELLRAQVTLANQRPDLVSRRMQRELAYLRLRQQIGAPPEQRLELTSGLDAAADVLAPEPPELAPAQRAPVRQAAHAVRASELDVDAARSAYYPNLSLSMSYGRVNYPDSVLPDLDDWRTNWTAGAYLSWAVFEGFRTRGQVQTAQAEAGRARARLAQALELARYEAEQVTEQITAARAVYEASASSVEQARRAYSIAEIRYREGVSTQLELADARLLLAQAEINRAQALRDLKVARVRRQLLRYLPLASGPVAADPGAPARVMLPAVDPTPAAPAAGGARGAFPSPAGGAAASPQGF